MLELELHRGNKPVQTIGELLCEASLAVDMSTASEVLQTSLSRGQGSIDLNPVCLFRKLFNNGRPWPRPEDAGADFSPLGEPGLVCQHHDSRKSTGRKSTAA